MNKSVLLLPTLALSTLLTGCVGSGPHTEAGAVTGAALGALAGGIIGNNSRGGDTVGGAFIGAAAGALAGGAIGNSVDHERGTIYGSPDDPAYRRARLQTVSTAASQPPPAPQEVQPPAPAPNAVWVAGYWTYDGRAYTWMSGRWEVPPPFATAYVPAHNEVRNGQTVYVPGYWR